MKKKRKERQEPPRWSPRPVNGGDLLSCRHGIGSLAAAPNASLAGAVSGDVSLCGCRPARNTSTAAIGGGWHRLGRCIANHQFVCTVTTQRVEEMLSAVSLVSPWLVTVSARSGRRKGITSKGAEGGSANKRDSLIPSSQARPAPPKQLVDRAEKPRSCGNRHKCSWPGGLVRVSRSARSPFPEEWTGRGARGRPPSRQWALPPRRVDPGGAAAAVRDGAARQP